MVHTEVHGLQVQGLEGRGNADICDLARCPDPPPAETPVATCRRLQFTPLVVTCLQGTWGFDAGMSVGAGVGIWGIAFAAMAVLVGLWEAAGAGSNGA